MAVKFLDKDGLGKVIAKLRSEIAAKVPNTRTVNNKPLSSNVSLTASDVGAMPSDVRDLELTSLSAPNGESLYVDCYDLASHNLTAKNLLTLETVYEPNLENDNRFLVCDRDQYGNVYQATASQAVDMLGIQSIPSATTADNGKVLMVVNGVPTWTSIPSANGVSF